MKSKGKIRFLVFATVAISAVVFQVFYSHRSSDIDEHSSQTAIAPGFETTSSPASPPQGKGPVSISTSQFALIPGQLTGKQKKEWNAFFNAPVNFFGKVVDENGDPVPGARVKYIIATASWNGSPTYEGDPSDSTGRFAILEKRGPRLTVWVEHRDYYRTDPAKYYFDYAHPDPLASPPPFVPKADSPVIFVLRKRGVGESLIHNEEIKTHIPLNGNPVEIDLRKGKVGSGPDSIVLVLKSDGGNPPFDWSFDVKAPGGGVIERTDQLDFHAPTEGYSSDFRIVQSRLSPREKWNFTADFDLFVRFSAGNFARIKVGISGRTGFCTIESYLNPSGSRNLENIGRTP